MPVVAVNFSTHSRLVCALGLVGACLRFNGDSVCRQREAQSVYTYRQGVGTGWVPVQGSVYPNGEKLGAGEKKGQFPWVATSGV